MSYTKEGYPLFVQQLNGGQVAAVTVNKRLRSMRVTLKNGQHVLALYPPHQSAATIAKLQGKHVRVTVLSPAQAKAPWGTARSDRLPWREPIWPLTS